MSWLLHPAHLLCIDKLVRIHLDLSHLLIAFFVPALLVWSCAGRQAAFLKRSNSAPSPNASELKAEADQVWEQRSDPEMARVALALYQKAFQAESANVEVGVSLARAHAFVGEYVESKPEVQDTLFLRGIEAGEKALALHPGFLSKYRRLKDETKTLSVLNKDWVPAIYWTAVNLEKWSATKSWVTRMGNKRRIEAYYLKVIELQDTYDYGGAYRFLGKVPARIPFGSKSDSRSYFEKAIRISPNYFKNRRVFAEVYAVSRNDRELYRQVLTTIVNGDPQALPEAYPENKFEQEIARDLLLRINERFKSSD